MSSPGPRILCVGLMCLDVINLVDRYPDEDEDIRAKHQIWQSGGNCTNTAKVLALIGRQCEFLGSLGSGIETEYGLAEMDKLGIFHNDCPIFQKFRLPSSHVILNTTSGSRTIIHFRGNFPELSHKDFLSVDLTKHGWIHFECRNPGECIKMIQSIREHCSLHTSKSIVISIEIEKKRSEYMDVVHLADVLIISKDFAMFCGYANKIDAVTGFRTKVKPGAVVICPWGKDGAAAIDADGQVYSCPASPTKVVDTLGAGDTFNAGLIHCLSSGKKIEESISYSCKLAGSKCEMLGFNGLKLNIDFDSTIS